jgi:hypothetical protein
VLHIADTENVTAVFNCTAHRTERAEGRSRSNQQRRTVAAVSPRSAKTASEPLRAHLGNKSRPKCNIPSQRAPEWPGEHFGRHLDINDPDADAKFADSISLWDQGLRVDDARGLLGKSASKFRAAASGSGSPQPQHRTEYRSRAVMRNAHAA